MKHSTLRRTGGIAAVAVSLSLGLAACGSDSSSDSSATDTTSSSAPAESSSAPTEESSSAAVDDAGAQTFGDGCSAVPTSGKGSFNGMVTDPVATAASNNPLLSTLVTAVGTVPGLADTLNGLDAATVFAPTNDAFAALPKATLDGLLADPDALSKVLTHHVLPENDDPTAVVGTKTTVNGDDLTISGDTTGMTVADGTVTANVLCGNIPTANATVYVIDAVLAGAK